MNFSLKYSLFMCVCMLVNAQKIEVENLLMPSPQKVEWQKGFADVKNATTEWALGKTDFARAKFIKADWQGFLKEKGIKSGNSYKFRFICEPDEKIEKIEEAYEKMKAEEVYTLVVNERETIIKSPSIRGIFCGIQTLEQLFVGKNKLKTCTIDDFPAFAIRGFMFDVGRNYAPMSMLKKVVDVIYKYKYNVFHFHFTENPGWRLESKIHSQVNDPKSMSRNPGKIYTQEEFKEFVEYCRLRNVLVIPEMDMPGHSESFRKAFGLSKMQDERATKILVELIAELASLVPAEKMPYIHIGTDEVKNNEKVDENTLKKYYAAVDKAGRRPLSWAPGLSVKGYNRPIMQTWTGRRRPPPAKTDFIDSQENYINHFDPFEAINTLYFRKNCDFSHANGIGGILCSWPDVQQLNPENHFTQTPIFPAILAYSEAIWRNPHKKDRLEFFCNLPKSNDKQFQEFKKFEERFLFHKEKYFKDIPFPYVQQTDIFWKIIGPLAHGGDVKKAFPIEQKITENYEIDGKKFTWHEDFFPGATIIYKHYCDYPTFFNGQKLFGGHAKDSTMYALSYFYSEKNQTVPVWISAHTWASSDRHTGTACIPNEWFHSSPKFLFNGEAIPAPNWQEKNRSGDQPFIDENYFYREPTQVKFKKGWNKILIKSPNNNATRRWMFTFVPITEPKKDFSVNVKRFPTIRPATPKEIEKLMKTEK